MPQKINILEVMGDPQVLGLVPVIFNAVAGASGAAPDKPVQLDAETVMESLLVLYSALLDPHPELKTEADMDEAADHARDMIAQMLRGCRRFYQETGGRMIEQWGARDPVMRPPDPPPAGH
jgi:hypothetical protein